MNFTQKMCKISLKLIEKIINLLIKQLIRLKQCNICVKIEMKLNLKLIHDPI
jgi:hypothetical protein